ncbi:hypothetical protein ACLF3G_28340 [Falsiroseomonas sp. HC035]|uniref:hypothetical protein n=1 Tax=Falsiroseomonas sp. HC035 TaxID=3390999 RepID=UPI003D31F060
MPKPTNDGFVTDPHDITIEYNEGPPGSGKSEYLKRIVVEAPRRYLLAVPTKKLLVEHATGEDGLRQRIFAAGLPPCVEVITISTATHARSVRRAVAEAADTYRARQHVVVICTHAAMMTTDLSAYSGWTLLVDEVPSIVACDTWRTGGSRAHLEAHYVLHRQPGKGAWSRVVVRSNAPSAQMISRDDLVGGAVAFHRRALSRSGVYANLQAWEEMESGDEWSWWSIWEVGELAAFDRVLLVGNAFSHSITRRLMAERPGEGYRARFQPLALPWTRRQHAARRVVLRYFTENPGSTTFWTNHPEGQSCIGAVSRWIADNTPAAQHMFACNNEIEAAVTQARVMGLRLTPCVAGSNDYDDFEHATMLFSAKISPQERKALTMFGIDEEEVRRSREFEAVLQFLFRSAIRRPEFDGTVYWNVYDGEQARFLASFIGEHRLAEVELQCVDVGIGHIVRPQRYAKVSDDVVQARHERRRQSNSERVRAHRERKQAERKAEGTYRGRGRPKKTDAGEARP